MATLAWFAGASPGKNSWVAYVVSVGFGFFGLLVLWSLIRQLAAAGLRETIVEVSTQPLQPGHSARICVIQPGPARLKSLRANLVCLEQRTQAVYNSQTKRHESRRTEKIRSTENLLEASHLRIAAGDTWHEVRDFSLPADAPIAGTEGDVRTLWKIEVWGAGYLLASFMHPFPVDVFHGERADEEDSDDEGDMEEDGAE
jgi:hypothetical protein